MFNAVTFLVNILSKPLKDVDFILISKPLKYIKKINKKGVQKSHFTLTSMYFRSQI